MVTLALVFIFVVMSVPLGIAAHQWLFKQADGSCDPAWERDLQRYE